MMCNHLAKSIDLIFFISFKDVSWFSLTLLFDCCCWLTCCIKDQNRQRRDYSSHIDTQINVGITQLAASAQPSSCGKRPGRKENQKNK